MKNLKLITLSIIAATLCILFSAQAFALSDDYILSDSNRKYLTEYDLIGFSKNHLRLARNEIYARHGLIFENQDLRDYFNGQAWYNGRIQPGKFNDSVLNPFEKENIALIQRMENSYTPPSSGYILSDSNKRFLTETELRGLNTFQLRLARNEIYARHGLIFENSDLRVYFSACTWYDGRIQPGNFSESVFNQYEKANIALIQKIENSYYAIPNYYILRDSSDRFLTESDLKWLNINQLRFARNEIYARHGLIFESKDLREYFGSQTWYNERIQLADFKDSVFNQYEKANIALIQKMESLGTDVYADSKVELKITMNQLRYTVNGQPAMFDVAPYLDARANRSMIPMRFIAEAFGASVTWNDAAKTQTITLKGKTFKLTQNVPLPDGMGTPVLVKDRFFVPLRYVSQELGASVDWDNATQTNTIVYYK